MREEWRRREGRTEAFILSGCQIPKRMGHLAGYSPLWTPMHGGRAGAPCAPPCASPCARVWVPMSTLMHGKAGASCAGSHVQPPHARPHARGASTPTRNTGSSVRHPPVRVVLLLMLLRRRRLRHCHWFAGGDLRRAVRPAPSWRRAAARS